MRPSSRRCARAPATLPRTTRSDVRASASTEIARAWAASAGGAAERAATTTAERSTRWVTDGESYMECARVQPKGEDALFCRTHSSVSDSREGAVILLTVRLL